MAQLLLTVIGEDRPGLVSTISGLVEARGGSWEESRLSRLGGTFAGIVLVSVATADADALVDDLAGLRDAGLHVVAERTDIPADRDTLRWQLDLVGDDHPGILAEVSAALAEGEVSIEELTTDVRDAPMAGGTVFEAHAVLAAPAGADADALRARLEAIAGDLMVEVRLSDDQETRRGDPLGDPEG